MSGQLTYSQVKNVDLTALGEAVAKWGQAPGKFSQVGTNFNTDVTKGLAGSNWQGEAADAAESKFRRVREQILAAAQESRRVATVLREGLEQFTRAKSTLEAIEGELEGHEYLRLNKTDGSVYLDLPADLEQHRSAMTKSYQDTFANYRERTRRAVQQANDADTALVQALTADVNGARRGFNSNAHASLDAARTATAKDLKTVLDLAEVEQGKLTSRQLAQLNAVLVRQSQNPEFAEQFATRLGAENTLKLWYNATHPHNPLYPDTKIDEKAWWKTAKSLQESLGTTLATASHADTPAMRQWQEDLLKLGPERVETGARTHPYGFQLMSNLMRFGTYESGFLNDYGDKLVAFDKKHNTKDGYAYWSNTADTDSLNLHGRGDNGQDPMTGFLEGLGHNPEASTEFFQPPGGVRGAIDSDAELNAHLTYLTQDRNWVFDGYRGDPRELPGHTALGHALTAATTGYPWDSEGFRGQDPEIYRDGGDRRTAATADIMEQVVHVYGGEDGPRLLHEQPGMAASLGQMGGTYIDDLNRGVAGLGNQQSDAFPPTYQGNAQFSSPRAIDFLSVLGHHEVSHGLMNQAQHLYTLDRLSELPPSGGEDNAALGRRALLTEAEVRGTLDHARASQIEAQYAADSTAAQASFQESGNWTRVGMSASAPMVVEGVKYALPATGPWGVAAAAVVAGGTEFAKLFHNDVVFGGPDNPEPVSYDQMFEQGEIQLGDVSARYYDGYDSGDRDFKGKLADDIKTSYRALGPQGNAFQGREPYTG